MTLLLRFQPIVCRRSATSFDAEVSIMEGDYASHHAAKSIIGGHRVIGTNYPTHDIAMAAAEQAIVSAYANASAVVRNQFNSNRLAKP